MNRRLMRYAAAAVVGSLLVGAGVLGASVLSHRDQPVTDHPEHAALSSLIDQVRTADASEGVEPAHRYTPPERGEYAVTLPDCEEGDTTMPCLTWDDHWWRIVWAYTPEYRGDLVHECRGGTPLIPCVEPQRAPGGGFTMRVAHMSLEG